MKFELSYNEKLYIVEDEYITEDIDEIPYIWEDGNYSCDCNRSLFIQRCCDENFPEMTCGHQIKLIRIVKE